MKNNLLTLIVVSLAGALSCLGERAEARQPNIIYLPPGSVSDHVSDFADLVPTLRGATSRQAKRELFYWEAAPQQALRRGPWKVYRAAPDQPLELYNLSEDLGETKNRAGDHPALVAEFTRLLQESRVDSPEFPLARKSKRSVNEP